jgi:hypothetical protein
MTVELLRDSVSNLHANRKRVERSGHPDRDAQFTHINRNARAGLWTDSTDCRFSERLGCAPDLGTVSRKKCRPMASLWL